MRLRFILLIALAACSGQPASPQPEPEPEPAPDAALRPRDAGRPLEDAAPRDLPADTLRLPSDAAPAESPSPSPDAVPAVDDFAKACPSLAAKQVAHASDRVFDPGEVVRFDLEMKPADWQWLLTHDEEKYVPATVVFCGLRFPSAGIRFRKSSHASARIRLGYAKNPILIDINELAPLTDQKLLGLRKISLDYGNDQLLLAERLNWEMLRAYGLKVSRVNSARLHVNGAYVGLFNNVERVDRSFAQYHYGNNDGNLYKHEYCGTWASLGADPKAYLTRCYRLKTNETTGDWRDLVKAIEVLNSGRDLETELPRVLNVEQWIRLAATLQAIGYGDTPAANGNNYYSYHSAAPDRFELAPWDLDGGYWRTGQPCEAAADTLNWDLFRISRCFPTVPLFNKVVAVARWRTAYLRAVRSFVDGPFAPAAFGSRLDGLVKIVAPHLAADPNRSGTEAAWRMQIESLRTLQRQRADAVRAQLERLGY